MDDRQVKTLLKKFFFFNVLMIVLLLRTLMELVTLNGKFITEAIPLEASIFNMVRRILQIIREEYTSELKNKPEETDPQESLHKILTSEGDHDVDFNLSVPTLREALIEHINEFEVELETW